jgi:Ca2+-dependent lipid-binding protein
MEFEIHDWDRVGSATHLGRGKIDLAAIEPFGIQELRLPVVHDKLGEKGSLNLRLIFQPESAYILSLLGVARCSPGCSGLHLTIGA